MKLHVRHILSLALLALSATPMLSLSQPLDTATRMSQIQVIGTHNSYHEGIAKNEQSLWSPEHAKWLSSLQYIHQSLTKQLNDGVRQLELDVYADHAGGLYAHPIGPKLVAKAGLPADPDFDPQHVMTQPGFKVMHIQDLDYRSVCQPFTACLKEIRTWSQAHPDHVPVYILIEPKEAVLEWVFPTTKPEPMDSAAFNALDAEIKSVFSANEILTPDDVRGNNGTLNHVVLTKGWPTLAQSRGKAMFLLDVQKLGPIYLDGHPSLKGRVLFTNAQPGTPDAAFIEINTPDAQKIADLVREGYLVRTRSDDAVQMITNATILQRDTALASGAQIVSTDYPRSEPESDTGFKVQMPDGTMMRCNPVNAPAACRSDALEPPQVKNDPFFLQPPRRISTARFNLFFNLSQYS